MDQLCEPIDVNKRFIKMIETTIQPEYEKVLQELFVKLKKDIDKIKYLVPKELIMNQFIYEIRKRLLLKSSDSIFVLVNNQLCSSNALIADVYEDYADKDGFLYVTYTSENTFG